MAKGTKKAAKIKKLSKKTLAKLRGGRQEANLSNWWNSVAISSNKSAAVAARPAPVIYPTCPTGKKLTVNGDADGKRDTCK